MPYRILVPADRQHADVVVATLQTYAEVQIFTQAIAAFAPRIEAVSAEVRSLKTLRATAAASKHGGQPRRPEPAIR